MSEHSENLDISGGLNMAQSGFVTGYKCAACGAWVFDEAHHNCSASTTDASDGWIECGICGVMYKANSVHVCYGTRQAKSQPWQFTWPPDPSNLQLQQQLDRIEEKLDRLLGDKHE